MRSELTMDEQNGKQGEIKDLGNANEKAMAEAANSS